MMSTRLRLLGCVAMLLAAGAIWWFATRPGDQAYTRIAYPCLPMGVVTTDPAQFIMVTGHSAPPLEHTMPDGSVVYPVFSMPDATVVPLVGGKVVFFPARFTGEDGLETPPLPPKNLPLNKMYRTALVRCLPDEASRQLKAAITGRPPATEGSP